MKMLKKIIVIALALMLVGTVLANPTPTVKKFAAKCDEPYNVVGLTRPIPLPTPVTDQQYQQGASLTRPIPMPTPVTDTEYHPGASLTKPIPQNPTPVCEWIWIMVKVTRWAD
jgi:hypothetical protein